MSSNPMSNKQGGNALRAYAAPYGGGFIAMIALPHKAQPFPLMEKGNPVRFDTKTKADKAAHYELVRLLNTPILAEAYFGKGSASASLIEEVFGSAKETPTRAGQRVIISKGKKGSSGRRTIVETRRHR